MVRIKRNYLNGVGNNLGRLQTKISEKGKNRNPPIGMAGHYIY